jgi:hypothetical protein
MTPTGGGKLEEKEMIPSIQISNKNSTSTQKKQAFNKETK